MNLTIVKTSQFLILHIPLFLQDFIMLTFAIDTIKKLSSTSSSNEKQEILKSTVSHPSVELLKYLILLTILKSVFI